MRPACRRPQTAMTWVLSGDGAPYENPIGRQSMHICTTYLNRFTPNIFCIASATKGSQLHAVTQFSLSASVTASWLCRRICWTSRTPARRRSQRRTRCTSETSRSIRSACASRRCCTRRPSEGLRPLSGDFELEPEHRTLSCAGRGMCASMHKTLACPLSGMLACFAPKLHKSTLTSKPWNFLLD